MVVLLQNLPRRNIVTIYLTQVVIDSTIKIEVNIRLLLECAVLRVPLRFKLH
jgi:hypothetical protein